MASIKKLMNMKGKTVLITGWAGKIAYAISEAYTDLDADLILLDNNIKNLNKSKSMLVNKFSINCEICHIDLEKGFSETIEWFRTPDLLYNSVLYNVWD